MNDHATVHIPTIYAAYSPMNGNAINTVVHGFVGAAGRFGHTARVLVSEDRAHGYGEDSVIVSDLGHRPGHQYRRRNDRVLDEVASYVGVPPLRASAFFRAVVDSLSGLEGTIIVHNQPDLVRVIRRRLPRRKVVLYCHNDLFGRRRRAALLASSAADVTICVSDFIADRLRDLAPSNSHRVLTVLNGVDTELFSPGTDRVGAAEPVVLFVGKLSSHKGAHLLIQALVDLAREGVEFRARVVGSSDLHLIPELTPYEHELRNVAAPIRGRLEFIPFVDRTKIAAVYRDASIFVLPSDWDEPCALTALEAMSSGLACVATNRGGTPQLVDKGALLFDPSMPGELAGRLRDLIRDREARLAAGRAARERAEALSWDHQYQELLGCLP